MTPTRLSAIYKAIHVIYGDTPPHPRQVGDTPLISHLLGVRLLTGNMTPAKLSAI